MKNGKDETMGSCEFNLFSIADGVLKTGYQCVTMNKEGAIEHSQNTNGIGLDDGKRIEAGQV